MAIRPEIRLAVEHDLKTTRLSHQEIADKHGIAKATVQKWSAALRRVRLAEQAKEQDKEKGK